MLLLGENPGEKRRRKPINTIGSFNWLEDPQTGCEIWSDGDSGDIETSAISPCTEYGTIGHPIHELLLRT